jgi:hypothetical protein
VGRTGAEVRFSARAITWLKVTITGVSANTQNTGLTEVEVLQPDR